MPVLPATGLKLIADETYKFPITELGVHPEKLIAIKATVCVSAVLAAF